MRTLTYYEKYIDTHKNWGLSELEVKKILDNAFIQLIEELIDDTPWTISKYYKDNRTNDDYVYDLIEGRVIEDLLVLWYQTNGNQAKRVGSDCDNRIVRSGKAKITTSADLEVNGELVEVQVSRQGKRNNYHIKKNKGNRILKGLNTLMFVVDNDYFIVDKELLIQCPIEKNYLWGGKETYVVDNSMIKYKPMK
jgi:hypothetical protein